MEVEEPLALIRFENYLKSTRFSIEFIVFHLRVKYPSEVQKHYGSISKGKVGVWVFRPLLSALHLIHMPPAFKWDISIQKNDFHLTLDIYYIHGKHIKFKFWSGSAPS